MKRLILSPAFMAIFAVAAAALIATYLYLYQTQQKSSNSSLAMGQVELGGPFNLIDEAGKPVTEKDFAGKYMLIYFGFTYCPDVCPTDLAVMGEAMAMMEDEDDDKASRITPIFITIDPERDVPDAIAEYTDHFHERMVGLTGELPEIAKTAKAYRVYFNKEEPDEDGDYVMSHSAFTYLMDPNGEFVTMFKHGSKPEQMAKDVLALVQ
ncbi:SCO family protein [Curvivirga aplysinae]|uniref:SCO family protein n=1 Tax=Curvivirga aplysinae TaxID=2529852 RepID=UPI001F313F47|nr:SCO family protein [Curvivirga aplysinae]